jgi:hypothetical protein
MKVSGILPHLSISVVVPQGSFAADVFFQQTNKKKQPPQLNCMISFLMNDGSGMWAMYHMLAYGPQTSGPEASVPTAMNGSWPAPTNPMPWMESAAAENIVVSTLSTNLHYLSIERCDFFIGF